MENKLEQLLNSLIEKGWKPFGRNYKAYSHGAFIVYDEYEFATNIRELTSKESGLWQFVCENGMAKDVSPQILMWQRVADKELSKFIGYNYYEYRLIESSLKEESELEEFLLSNIKVDEKDKD